MCNCTRRYSNNNKQPSLKHTPTVQDTKSKAILLWKGVLNNESNARIAFVNLYLQKFPQNKILTENLSKENLHRMYMELTH